jgi:hypothetical protein
MHEVRAVGAGFRAIARKSGGGVSKSAAKSRDIKDLAKAFSWAFFGVVGLAAKGGRLKS